MKALIFAVYVALARIIIDVESFPPTIQCHKRQTPNITPDTRDMCPQL